MWRFPFKKKQFSSSLHWEADAGLAIFDRAFLTLAGI
jgi:hypothetical protein